MAASSVRGSLAGTARGGRGCRVPAREAERQSVKDAKAAAKQAARDEKAAARAAKKAQVCRWVLLTRIPGRGCLVGERVQGKYEGADGGANWFAGAVVASHPDGTLHIRYDDGDEETSVQPRYVKVMASKAEEEAALAVQAIAAHEAKLAAPPPPPPPPPNPAKRRRTGLR